MSDYARGAEFRRLRETKRLSQEDAAHELKVSVKTVRSWEHGGGIKWPNAQRVAAFYGVDPEDLVDRELAAPEDPEQLGRVEAKLDALTEKVAALDARVRAADTRQRSAGSPRQSQADQHEDGNQ